MIRMNCLINWSWLLTIALFIPINLPAGGSERNSFKPLISYGDSPFFANKLIKLRLIPYIEAPIMRSILPGDPIKVLRIWESPNGDDWVHIQINAKDISSSQVTRGWIIA
tara:strand:+ start:339 stop:668 length:330 start_codon:yes stop_codon:yes gene_type:complete